MPKHKKQMDVRVILLVLAAMCIGCLAGACWLMFIDGKAEDTAKAYTDEALREAELIIPGEPVEQTTVETADETEHEQSEIPEPTAEPIPTEEAIPLENEQQETEEEEEDDMSGYSYMGILAIPAIDVRLAVYDEYDRLTMKHGAFRYCGSISGGNLVIGAHNYTTWFGKIKNLQPGDTATLKDTDGNKHTYTVTEVFTIGPYDTDELVGGDDWDMTLFTCVPGGKKRVVVRLAS